MPTHDPKVISEMIADCAQSKYLTRWETDFIESLANQWANKEWLSKLQEEKLEKIHGERV